MAEKKTPPDKGPGREAQVYPLEERDGVHRIPGEFSPESAPVSPPPVPPLAGKPGTGKPGPAPAATAPAANAASAKAASAKAGSAKAPGRASEPLLPAAEGGWLREGIRLFRMKRYDMALKELSRADGTGFSVEDNAELAYYLGLCHTKLGNYEEALIYLDQVITTGQNVLRSYQCRMALSYIYVITRKGKMAEFELTRLRKSGFESAQLYTTLAYIAWTRKNVKEALDFYEQALGMDENNTTAMNGLGYILVETDTDISRGLKLCRRAVDRKPQNAAYLDSLGWACFKNGDVLSARTWLRRAIDLASGEREIQDHWRVVTGEEPPRGR
ncbi:MAG: tetratricopeptide repeat protein [Treponema sp.]|jgi:tetratricopeptide (TPR) repeat protein|nr:tetratricopeptide repeat protein [Treponema sp.]